MSNLMTFMTMAALSTAGLVWSATNPAQASKADCCVLADCGCTSAADCVCDDNCVCPECGATGSAAATTATVETAAVETVALETAAVETCTKGCCQADQSVSKIATASTGTGSSLLLAAAGLSVLPNGQVTTTGRTSAAACDCECCVGNGCNCCETGVCVCDVCVCDGCCEGGCCVK